MVQLSESAALPRPPVRGRCSAYALRTSQALRLGAGCCGLAALRPRPALPPVRFAPPRPLSWLRPALRPLAGSRAPAAEPVSCGLAPPSRARPPTLRSALGCVAVVGSPRCPAAALAPPRSAVGLCWVGRARPRGRAAFLPARSSGLRPALSPRAPRSAPRSSPALGCLWSRRPFGRSRVLRLAVAPRFAVVRPRALLLLNYLKKHLTKNRPLGGRPARLICQIIFHLSLVSPRLLRCRSVLAPYFLQFQNKTIPLQRHSLKVSLYELVY